MASTLKIKNIDTASGTTITLPTGKTLVGTDEGAFRVPGTILQVKSYKLGSGYTNSTEVNISSGNVFIGGGTITPKSASSLILVISNQQMHNDTAGPYGYLRVVRTISGGSDVIIDTPGNATGYQDPGNGNRLNFPGCVLDNPNTTSSIQYRHRVDHLSGSIDNRWNYSGGTSMTLLEIAQ